MLPPTTTHPHPSYFALVFEITLCVDKYLYDFSDVFATSIILSFYHNHFVLYLASLARIEFLTFLTGCLSGERRLFFFLVNDHLRY